MLYKPLTCFGLPDQQEIRQKIAQKKKVDLCHVSIEKAGLNKEIEGWLNHNQSSITEYLTAASGKRQRNKMGCLGTCAAELMRLS